MIFILLAILVITLVYWKLRTHYNYWKSKGVKQRKQIYFWGDYAGIFFGKESVFDAMINMYKAFPDERYLGTYEMTTPTLYVTDIDLIKQICVKDFDHFLNHVAFVPEGVDPLWNKNLFALKDTEWREMRSTLSPSFTSSKMKMLFSLISECADEFTDHFLKTGDNHVLEMKDTFTRFTNDVIASVAFGIKCDSIKDRENEFFVKGKRAIQFGTATNVKFLVFLLAPKLSRVLGLTFFPKDVTQFFFNVVKEAIQVREAQGIVRPDVLNLLLEARKGKKLTDSETNGVSDTGFATVEESIESKESKSPKQQLTDLDIAAQAMIFFFGGFESTATLMTFSAYELALNPDIQEKLQYEVDETLEECKGKLTYEALMNMKYMDMVVSETLRKWPAGLITDRVCTKSYSIEPVLPNEKPVQIKLGQTIRIPISALHYDPSYFPNPEKFDPERFNDVNKINIKSYSYLPFGAGPRNCIGSRFALMEAKTILFYMLSKFELLVCPKTDVPIKLNRKSFQLIAENGAWLEVKPRVK